MNYSGPLLIAIVILVVVMASLGGVASSNSSDLVEWMGQPSSDGASRLLVVNDHAMKYFYQAEGKKWKSKQITEGPVRAQLRLNGHSEGKVIYIAGSEFSGLSDAQVRNIAAELLSSTGSGIDKYEICYMS